MRKLAVEINNVTFSYNSQKPFISDINLAIEKHQRFGIFGPNGAGKTTIMSLMAGLLKPMQGSILLMGEHTSSEKNTKKLFGYVPQDFAFYPELTPIENLQFFGAWYGMPKKEIKKRSLELLTILGLYDVRNKQIKKFSGGMKRRVNIAIGIMHNPKIIFLDEPTAGVDIQSRHAIISYLKELNAAGTTLIYTSHHLKEAEDLCNAIALIDQGKIIAHDSLQNLLESHQSNGLEGLFLKLTGNAYRD